MTSHIFCITVDTDPDGLSGTDVNRETLDWRSLEGIGALLEKRDELSVEWGTPLPITWFVRADRQIREQHGTSLYLLQRFQVLWTNCVQQGDELAWHPHLYEMSEGHYRLVTDGPAAIEQIDEVWAELETSGMTFQSFRSGEGWLPPGVLDKVERIGLSVDSTAIPGRKGSSSNPMNWEGTPNEPFFPNSADFRRPGPRRLLLEMPMNTWSIQTSYDRRPTVRYMNPAVHENLFAEGAGPWSERFSREDRPLWAWILVMHPDEVLVSNSPDRLYAKSPRAFVENLRVLKDRLVALGHSCEFATVHEASLRWRAMLGT